MALVDRAGGAHRLALVVGRLGDGVGGDGGGDGEQRDDQHDAGEDGRPTAQGGGNQQDGNSQEGRLARGVQLRVDVGNPTMP